MKRFLTSLLVALFAMCGATSLYAQDAELAGKILTVGSAVTTLEEGKWYLFRNTLTSAYVVETDGKKLVARSANPNNTSAEASAGYLMKLEKQEDGRYLVKTGLGNYLRRMGKDKNNGTSAQPESDAPFTIEAIEGATGRYTLLSTLASGLKYYMQVSNGAISGIATRGGLNSSRDWLIREANLTGVGELTGKDYVNYILSKDGLVRLTNRRSNTYNLADDGTRTLGQPADNTSRHQVWIMQKSGTGYTLRNGATGRYLNDDDNYRTPSVTATTVYIQYSPNNGASTSWVNVCEEGDFGGSKCLNENGDRPEDLYRWSVAGDAGSDWTITPVEEFTMEEIQEGLKGNAKYNVVEDGKIYHIYNLGYSTVIYEDIKGNTAHCQGMDESKYMQYWRVEATGSKFYLKNVLTNRYLKRQNGALSSVYTTTENATQAQNGFTLNLIEDPTENIYAVVDNGAVGLHCDAASNVVGWYHKDNVNSLWGFAAVELTEEDIAEARQNYQDYLDLSANIGTYDTHLQALFADRACTVLKDGIQSLPDEALAANEDYQALNAAMKAMVMKVKNNTWQVYTGSDGYSRDFEKFFRVRDDYKVYSHFQKMAENNYCSMSNCFGKLSGPTGIVAKTGEIVYIYLDEEPSADCTLQVEAVTDTDSPGDRQTGTVTDLHQGLNVITVGDDCTLYIFYQLEDPEKYLADYPDMKIHIEGGELQGYWDATRGMTNADWALLREQLLDKSKVVNLKTNRLVFAMSNTHVQNAVGASNEMEGLMRIWNTILQNEEDMMGFQKDLEGRFNNIWNCFSIDHSYMYATSYGTYYENSTLATIMNYRNMTRTGGGNLWGPSHEMGHNHQASINVVGTTEASNNLFSNINVYLQGSSTSRGDALATTLAAFAANKPWSQRGIWAQAQFFYQLYLYFHVLGNDPNFYPKLFKAMRQDPIDKGSWDGSLTAVSNGETIKGGYKSYGKNDYLKLAKKICDVAQADLSEMFEAYGMFVPVSDYYIGDYSDYWMTTTQEDIDEAKAYMQQYPKKLGNILFIEDRIKQSPAIVGGVFEGVPSGEYRQPISNEECNQIGVHGSVGQYGDFKHTFEADSYFYSSSDYTRKIAINRGASGAVGFKVYNLEGKLVYLSNETSFTLPKAIYDAGFIVKAAEGNGEDIIVPRSGNKIETDVYYPDQEESRVVYADASLQPLPANALMVVRAGQENETPEELKAVTNVVDETGHATRIAIDGDMAWRNPVDFQAASVVFTKSNDGYAALNLPFAVTSETIPGLRTATYTDGILSITEATELPVGYPVVVEGNVDITVADAAVQKGDYTAQENIKVLTADGQSVETVGMASPFLYDMQQATAIGRVEVQPAGADDAVYDLQGRRVDTKSAKKGIYIMGGKKVLK